MVKFSPRQRIGRNAESEALRYLKKAGLRLVQRNYTCRYGEIDLIMQDGDNLVFVEVRQRTNPNFGGAAVTVDARKQRKIVRSAEHYLQKLRGPTPACRIDVVALEPDNTHWIKNAIMAE